MQRESILERMKQNEFIPRETFETFVNRKLGNRTGKRIYFPEQDQQVGQRELLNNYLQAMRDKEQYKLD